MDVQADIQDDYKEIQAKLKLSYKEAPMHKTNTELQNYRKVATAIGNAFKYMFRGKHHKDGTTRLHIRENMRRNSQPIPSEDQIRTQSKLFSERKYINI